MYKRNPYVQKRKAPKPKQDKIHALANYLNLRPSEIKTIPIAKPSNKALIIYEAKNGYFLLSTYLASSYGFAGTKEREKYYKKPYKRYEFQVGPYTALAFKKKDVNELFHFLSIGLPLRYRSKPEIAYYLINKLKKKLLK